MNDYLPQPCVHGAGHTLDLSTPHVMGILNVTPDSFSDGGKYSSLDSAMTQAASMLQQGASIIDVGGESTRPGASPVPEQEELDRVCPVIERLVKEYGALVSLDTSSPAVIREGARLGAFMVNDVRSLTRPGALEAAVESKLSVSLMHMKGEPQVMQQAPHYDEPVEVAVYAFLQRHVERCLAAGISRDHLVIDPGFGFGKNLDHNLRLMNEMASLQALGLPILVGTSRKGMIGQVLADEAGAVRSVNDSRGGRLYGGLALSTMAVERGARIIRTHDVGATADALALTWAVMSTDKS
ncbi:Dihydropteroate synthase [Halomonadaceae bacterium LMG 33818]|uniref:dihydropteroate synthase n=1 Tax=Cernens ardua TaxID=3402176 RepID=UPI003EDC1D85